ncbi:MAG: type II toxin-antitoxin system HicB family antitoxin [Planctomycetes bacterium]|nr:type II toxin-antitoxin system HicB family antitoxin [Planctomycetota bacterium]
MEHSRCKSPFWLNAFLATVFAREEWSRWGSAATPEEAVAKLRELCEAKLQHGAELISLELGPRPHAWMEFAGMFKDDPWIEDWKRSIEEYRQKIEDDPDAL